MRCDEILGQGSRSIEEEVPDNFHTKLSDQLGFDS